MKGDHATYHSSLFWSSSWKRARRLFHKMPCTQSTDPGSSPPPPHPQPCTLSQWKGLACSRLSLSSPPLNPAVLTSPDKIFPALECSCSKGMCGPTVSSDRTPLWSLRCLACMHVKSLLSCLILCDPMDCSPPGSSVHGLSRWEYWRGLLCPSPGDLPNLGIEPSSLMYPAQAGGFLTTRATWEAP